MPDDTRHHRELQAAMQQIKDVQKRARRKWRLDVPVARMTCEGIGVFVVAFLVGRGLGSFYYVLRGWIFG